MDSIAIAMIAMIAWSKWFEHPALNWTFWTDRLLNRLLNHADYDLDGFEYEFQYLNMNYTRWVSIWISISWIGTRGSTTKFSKQLNSINRRIREKNSQIGHFQYHTHTRKSRPKHWEKHFSFFSNEAFHKRVPFRRFRRSIRGISENFGFRRSLSRNYTRFRWRFGWRFRWRFKWKDSMGSKYGLQWMQRVVPNHKTFDLFEFFFGFL